MRFLLNATFSALAAIATGHVALLTDKQAQRLTLSDTRISVHGLAWYGEDKPAFIRLPTRLKATFPSRVWGLAQTPAGVRLRFDTDSEVVGLVAQGNALQTSDHNTRIGSFGVDFYVDGQFMDATAPDAKGKISVEWHAGLERKRRTITLYLPFGKPVQVQEIVVAPGASVWPAKPYSQSLPVVYYGSSITQGSAASNPGLTFPALLGRWLDHDFINLGFSGNGMGEPALAHAIAELKAACFVVDYWANPPAEVYRETLPKFIDILRAKHPRTPIIVTGPYYNPSEEVPGSKAGKRQLEKRAFAAEFVAARRAAGDTLITHADGLEMISRDRADGLVDGRHANSMGFYFCARGLEPYLRAALKLPPRGP